ncbi:ARM repeat-containing protein [Basidiobolus meristosporus CBS 931.73]|uniref:Nucleolar protein 9 n=1 Tax=Basidiobolus meristosporus CBS 931.73 TaxID=1314790 RepID=A0A1Y1Y4X9_9FUNG|nr:ARM repeat-containing protein [Basidiobolus meristosporus CBS 931.73]|eukprot:ORX93043.1 ARM repeat-containing protein [Basidiobolus meristosporus CBS 931.73]
MPRDKQRRGRRGKKSGKGETQDAPEQNYNEYDSRGAAEERYEPTSQQEYDDPNNYYQGENDWENHNFSRAHYGRLDPDIQQYFKGVESKLENDGFENNEERDLFLENVYAEVDNKELQLTTDHSCSLILEKLFKISNEFQLRVFFSKLPGKFIECFVHRFASHVCQTLLSLAAGVMEQELKGENVIENEKKEGEENPLPSMESMFLDMCKELQPHWNSLIADPYASHIIRVILIILSGEPLESESGGKTTVRSKKSAKYNEEHNSTALKALTKPRQVPPSFTKMLDEVTNLIITGMSDVVVRSLAVHAVASPVLQLLLVLQSKKDESLNDDLIDKLLMGISSKQDEVDDIGRRDNFVDTLIKDQVGSHLFEKILQVSSASLFQLIYTTYFRGRLANLCQHPIANFVVQHLLTNAKSEGQLEVMISEIVPDFSGFLMRGRSGVIRSSIDACVRLGCCYKEVVKGICKAFGANTMDERKEFVNLVIRMQSYDRYIHEPSKFHPQGALMLQSLLLFPEEHNSLVMNSYLSQPLDSTYSWTLDPIGSRVVESFLTSPNVSLKAKRKIIRSFAGKYHEMAMDKYGSHIVDKCWAVSDIELKEKIATELVLNEKAIAACFHGKFILRNCQIDQFKRKREEWIEKEKGVERKKEMFKDILGDAVYSKSKDQKTDIARAKLPVPSSNLGDLGFSESMAPEAPTEKKDKRKKHNPEAMVMKEMDEDLGKKQTYVSDEIDLLFKKKRKLGLTAHTNNESDHDNETEDDDDDEEEKAEKPAKKKSKKSKDLLSVLDAIDATKKKKSKSEKKERKQDKEEKSKKKSKAESKKEKKERRKFAS